MPELKERERSSVIAEVIPGRRFIPSGYTGESLDSSRWLKKGAARKDQRLAFQVYVLIDKETIARETKSSIRRAFIDAAQQVRPTMHAVDAAPQRIDRAVTLLAQRTVLASELKQTFDTLAQQWRRETEQISDAEAIILHPAYQRIIGLGEPVVHLIFQELQARPDHWYWALKMITGTDPVPPDANTMRQVREAWLAYGRRRGYCDVASPSDARASQSARGRSPKDKPR